MKGLTLIALSALIAGPVYAGCAAPEGHVTVPDGSTASKDELLAAQRAVKEYNAAMEAFNSCLNLEQDAAIAARGKNITAEERKLINEDYTARYNAELAKLQTVADQLNTQIRAYKAAHAPAK